MTLLKDSIGFGLGQMIHANDDQKIEKYYRVAKVALDSGIRVYDTAPNYAQGMSETIFGRALKACQNSVDRNDLTIIVKGGYPANLNALTPYEMTPDDDGVAQIAHHVHCMNPNFLRAEFSKSIERLGINHADVYLLHNPEEQLDAFGKDIFHKRLMAAFKVASDLRRTGKVNHIGIACSQDIFDIGAADFLDLVAATANDAGITLDVVQIPFSLSCTDALWPKDGSLPFLNHAEALNITVMTSASLGKMFLPLKTISTLGKAYGLKSIAQVALEFARTAPAVGCAFFGSNSETHIRELAELAIQKANEKYINELA
jgi:aryl-alcohol dehydrogenase-like predicted oxidoreductase